MKRHVDIPCQCALGTSADQTILPDVRHRGRIVSHQCRMVGDLVLNVQATGGPAYVEAVDWLDCQDCPAPRLHVEQQQMPVHHTLNEPAAVIEIRDSL